ncbi:MAG: ribbon-helix-helix protein, CopG family [bacterium]
MKTAISLPDELFASADALARRLGMSRSGLIAAALAEFVAKHRGAKVSDRLNALYTAEDSRVDESTRAAQRRAVTRPSEW